MKSRLYIFVLGAMLIATWSTVEARESEKSGQPGKKKMQVILVPKKDRDRSGEGGKTDATRPRNHGPR